MNPNPYQFEPLAHACSQSTAQVCVVLSETQSFPYLRFKLVWFRLSVSESRDTADLVGPAVDATDATEPPETTWEIIFGAATDVTHKALAIPGTA
jgi:hypothetical protein